MCPIPTSDLPPMEQPPTDHLTYTLGSPTTGEAVVTVRPGTVVVGFDGTWSGEALVLTDGDNGLADLIPVQRAVIVARLRAHADRIEHGASS